MSKQGMNFTALPIGGDLPVDSPALISISGIETNGTYSWETGRLEKKQKPMSSG